MRRVLLASLPLVSLLVIGISFFLLNKQHLSNQSLLSFSSAATTIKSPIPPVIPAKPILKVTPIIQATVTPTPKVVASSTPSPTIVVTATPTPIPTRIPTPTLRPTATPTPVRRVFPTIIAATATPTPTRTSPPPVSGDSVQSYIMQRINEYRASVGLGSVSTNSNTCDFAKTRAGEIAQNFNHDGFTNRNNSHTLPYSSFSAVTENIAMTSDYTQVVTLWINSPGHAENMRKDTPYVCVERSGNYYAYEGWKP